MAALHFAERGYIDLGAQGCLDILNAYLRCSGGCVVVVNPDNPSGAFLSRDDLTDILDACKRHGTICIVDESFADFAERVLRFTLLSDGTLEAYPNLIVIKSISKSYGVPGIRLGVLATADAKRLQAGRS